MTLVEKQADFVRTHEISNGISDPTRITYGDLVGARDYFNHHLFAGRLPRCLITMQRRRGAYGYFAGDRFRTVDGSEVTDEIALNPAHFHSCTTEQVLSTLVHEMTHLEQHHFREARSARLSQQAVGAPDGSRGADPIRYRCTRRQKDRLSGQ